MDLGYFAIDREGNVALLNEEALKFTRNDGKNIRWYGRGTAENGDLVLYLGKHAADCIREEQAQHALPANDTWSLVLFQYENPDCFPLIKQWESSEALVGEQVLLDTVFSQVPIRV